ncbi:DNA repair protein rad10 [Pelomyxa schiedti]|nr:DNA repair protein rad10 [Pelomyxa schiedti]
MSAASNGGDDPPDAVAPSTTSPQQPPGSCSSASTGAHHNRKIITVHIPTADELLRDRAAPPKLQFTPGGSGATASASASTASDADAAISISSHDDLAAVTTTPSVPSSSGPCSVPSPTSTTCVSSSSSTSHSHSSCSGDKSSHHTAITSPYFSSASGTGASGSGLRSVVVVGQPASCAAANSSRPPPPLGANGAGTLSAAPNSSSGGGSKLPRIAPPGEGARSLQPFAYHAAVAAATVPVLPVSSRPPPQSTSPPLTVLQGNPRPGHPTIIVNRNQESNRMMKLLKNVAWVFGETVADFQISDSTVALFLSLRYHMLHPKYIATRIDLLKGYALRLLLVLVDTEDSTQSIKELTKICFAGSMTMIVSWSKEECARYIETYKLYENKPADIIKERLASSSDDYFQRLTEVLTSCRFINKTDVVTLATHFGSLSSIASASIEELSTCPGFGPRKAERLYSLFHAPLKGGKPNKKKQITLDQLTTSQSQQGSI